MDFSAVDFTLLVAGVVLIGTGIIGLTMTETGVKVTKRLIKSA